MGQGKHMEGWRLVRTRGMMGGYLRINDANGEPIVSQCDHRSGNHAEEQMAVMAQAPTLLDQRDAAVELLREVIDFLNDGYPPEEISPQEKEVLDGIDAFLATLK